MNSIYLNAVRVLCWLGAPNDEGIVNPGGDAITIKEALARAWDGAPSDPGALDACLQFSNSSDKLE